MAAIASMTGAGFAAGDSEFGPVRVEMRSINGRGLSTKLRLPSACNGLEAAIEDRVRGRIARGTVTVVVERAATAVGLPDRQQLGALAAEMTALADELQLARPTLVELLQLASSGRADSATSRELPEGLAALIDSALDDLLRHRFADGAGTVDSIRAHLDEFVAEMQVAAERTPQMVEDYRQRLLQRVQEFVQACCPEPPPAVDLVREVASYADRVDVIEELQRLRTHLDEFRNLLLKGGQVGRRLEFLLQELLRETNTLGSKSPDTVVAHCVVAMKSNLSTIKEQVANLE